MFYSCERCSTILDPTIECTCSDNQRMITSTWTSIELQKAVNCYGYKIVKVYEIYNYKERTTYNPPESEGLFGGYMDSLFKIKEAASGFPDYCNTEEKKDLYIKELEEKLNLKLTKSQIKKNSGLRWVGKILLNSLWG